MKHLPTIAKRAILSLTALTAALALLFTAACSGNEVNPTSPPDHGEQALVEEINRLKSETASLRQEVEELRSAEEREPAQSTVQAEPEGIQTTKTPETQETTKPARPAETSNGTLTGICYRTPELQEVLLETLDVELCQVINEKELYRIRDLKVNMPSVKEGDFEGLVNVESLSVTTGPIGMNGLRGLESLRELSLSAQKMDGLVTGSFLGLESIEELTISVSSNEHTGLQLPELPNLPNLKHLRVYKMRPQSPDEESISPFGNLENLESIDLTLMFGNAEDDAREEPYQIPVNLFSVVPTATPGATPATTLTITVAPIPEGISEYDRSDWKHWTDVDGDCQDARQEVLVKESMTPVTFETDRGCRVATGRWYGAFTGVYVEDPSDLDIDHLVPLKNAHLSGGWRWNAEMREEYANNLSDPDHLIAVTAGANRSKGAKGPEEWRPPDLDYLCQYATDWTEVKARWELTMTEYETDIVMDMLGTCENPQDLELWEALETATGEHKPTPELQNSVYGSCDDAEAAGEQRVHGSRGGGRGFPKGMVPSARDGDGDGVVCER